MFVYALNLKDDARTWLMENGYAHLLAMINGVEGNQDAIHWLRHQQFSDIKAYGIGRRRRRGCCKMVS